MTAHAQEEKVAEADSARDKKATKELPLEPERTFRLQTDEGVCISLDGSPDGKTIPFDVMGDIYTIPISGGSATPSTSGMAFDAHPRFNPDGKMIGLTSDKSGSENSWTLDLTDSEAEPKKITKNADKHYQEAEWTSDGKCLIVAKGGRLLELHMFHKEAGGGVQLMKKPDNLQIIEPAFGADDRYI